MWGKAEYTQELADIDAADPIYVVHGWDQMHYNLVDFRGEQASMFAGGEFVPTAAQQTQYDQSMAAWEGCTC